MVSWHTVRNSWKSCNSNMLKLGSQIVLLQYRHWIYWSMWVTRWLLLRTAAITSSVYFPGLQWFPMPNKKLDFPSSSSFTKKKVKQPKSKGTIIKIARKWDSPNHHHIYDHIPFLWASWWTILCVFGKHNSSVCTLHLLPLTMANSNPCFTTSSSRQKKSLGFGCFCLQTCQKNNNIYSE